MVGPAGRAGHALAVPARRDSRSDSAQGGAGAELHPPRWGGWSVGEEASRTTGFVRCGGLHPWLHSHAPGGGSGENEDE